MTPLQEAEQELKKTIQKQIKYHREQKEFHEMMGQLMILVLIAGLGFSAFVFCELWEMILP